MKKEHIYFRIAVRIAALITGVATDEDRQQLDGWKQENQRRAELIDELGRKDVFEENQRLLEAFPAEEGWKKIEKRLDVGHKMVLKGSFGMWWKYAAILVLAIGGGVLYFTRERSLHVETTTIAEYTIPSGKQGAKLILGDGKVIEVTPDNQFVVTEADGTLIRKDSVGIDYTQAASGSDSLVFNQMETLTGMEYTLTLADGTRVYLNAESRLKFPVTFRGEERVVELSGEAYFQVAKDASHPFIVRMDGVDVKVLGTSFNARSYFNENQVVTTLIEGKVDVNGRQIVPGEQALFTKVSGQLEVKQVDTDQYIGWHEGRFIFRNERLEDVMKTLARWYGVDYHFVDEGAKDIRIGARFGRYDSMEPIIGMLRQTNLVNVLQSNRSLYISVK